MVFGSIFELKLYVVFFAYLEWIVISHPAFHRRILIVARFYRIFVIILLLIVRASWHWVQHCVYCGAEMPAHSCHRVSDLSICDCKTLLLTFFSVLCGIAPGRRELVFFFYMNRSKCLLTLLFILFVTLLPFVACLGLSWLLNEVVFLAEFVLLHLCVFCGFSLLDSLNLTCSYFVFLVRRIG